MLESEEIHRKVEKMESTERIKSICKGGEK